MMLDLKQFKADPLQFFTNITIPAAHGNSRFADVMAHHQYDWFEAIAPSLLAVANGQPPPTTRFWVERTKGASKDSDAACVLLWLLAFSGRTLSMQVGAADRDQAAEVKKAAQDVLRLNRWLATRIDIQAWKLICKATNSECEILAADEAGSHGARPDIVFMNELSHVTKEEFAANLLDNATKKPHGIVIVATNSGFLDTWQQRWRQTAIDSERWHVQLFSEPAPWLSDEELEEAERRNSSARFQRLFWGQWVSQSGDALDADDVQASIDHTLTPGTKVLDEGYVAGLDLGVKQDHSALVVVAFNRATQQLRLADARSWRPHPTTRKVDLMAVESEVVVAHSRYELSVCGYDPHQAALMAQRLQLRNIPMQEMRFNGANLNRMASSLLDTFRSRRITLYNHPQLIKDLTRLTIEEKEYGYRLSAVRNESGHADLAVALSIALPLAIEKAGQPEVWAGVPDDNMLHSPYARALADFEYRRAEFAREQVEMKRWYNDTVPGSVKWGPELPLI